MNDSEATRRVISTGDYLDMCNKCYFDIASAVPTELRPDLNPEESVSDYEEGTQEDWKDVVDEEWQSS